MPSILVHSGQAEPTLHANQPVSLSNHQAGLVHDGRQEAARREDAKLGRDQRQARARKAFNQARTLAAAHSPPHGLHPLPSLPQVPPYLLTLALANDTVKTPIVSRARRMGRPALTDLAAAVTLPIGSLRATMGRMDSATPTLLPVKHDLGAVQSRRRQDQQPRPPVPRLIPLDPALCFVPTRRPPPDRLKKPRPSAAVQRVHAAAARRWRRAVERARTTRVPATLDELPLQDHGAEWQPGTRATLGFSNHLECEYAERTGQRWVAT